MKLSAKVQKLTDLIAPAIAVCDVVLWGIEFKPQGKRSLLRVYVDLPENINNPSHSNSKPDEKPKSVAVEDCMRVSHQVSGILDVHDPISGEYVLEVSSPGWDRAFFSPEQMQPYIGETVAIRLIHAVAQRRKMTGKLINMNAESLHIQLADSTDSTDSIEVSFDNIDKANLVYQD